MRKQKRKISEKQKDKIINSLAISALILFFISIATYFIVDIKQTKKHLEECRVQCLPGEVIENLSFKHCVCKKTLSVEDTI